MLGEDYLYMKKVPAEAKHQARIDTSGGTWTQFDVSIQYSYTYRVSIEKKNIDARKQSISGETGTRNLIFMYLQSAVKWV